MSWTQSETISSCTAWGDSGAQAFRHTSWQGHSVTKRQGMKFESARTDTAIKRSKSVPESSLLRRPGDLHSPVAHNNDGYSQGFRKHDSDDHVAFVPNNASYCSPAYSPIVTKKEPSTDGSSMNLHHDAHATYPLDQSCYDTAQIKKSPQLSVADNHEYFSVKDATNSSGALLSLAPPFFKAGSTTPSSVSTLTAGTDFASSTAVSPRYPHDDSAGMMFQSPAFNTDMASSARGHPSLWRDINSEQTPGFRSCPGEDYPPQFQSLTTDNTFPVIRHSEAFMPQEVSPQPTPLGPFSMSFVNSGFQLTGLEMPSWVNHTGAAQWNFEPSWSGFSLDMASPLWNSSNHGQPFLNEAWSNISAQSFGVPGESEPQNSLPNGHQYQLEHEDMAQQDQNYRAEEIPVPGHVAHNFLACTANEPVQQENHEVAAVSEETHANANANISLAGLCSHSRKASDKSSSVLGKRSRTSKAGNLKPRKHFGEKERQETSRTRDIGACIRCKIQRVRCKFNPDDPDGPCVDCLRVSNNPSRKVIHHIGCHRYKLQETVIFRTDGVPITKRWQGAQVRDIITIKEPRLIHMEQGFKKPFCFYVRRFEPQEESEYMRFFVKQDSICAEEIPPYALVSVHDVKTSYRKYIDDNWESEFRNAIRWQQRKYTANPWGNEYMEPLRDLDGGHWLIIGDIYELALVYLRNLPERPGWDFYRAAPTGGVEGARKMSERDFMTGILKMVFVLRQALGSSWIHEDDIPGSIPHMNFKPLEGQHGTPRMAVAQIDCIRITWVLRPLSKPLLKVLMMWVAERNYECWLSIFYASFILLQEIATATFDAYKHGRWRENRETPGGDGGDFKKPWAEPCETTPNHARIVSEMHESANVILAHWHYFNCNNDPGNLTDDEARGKSPLMKLTPEQFEGVKSLWKRMKCWMSSGSESGGLYANKMGHEWCHPLYFAAQMFETGWKPKKVYSW